jgi:hypothetical protein
VFRALEVILWSALARAHFHLGYGLRPTPRAASGGSLFGKMKIGAMDLGHRSR